MSIESELAGLNAALRLPAVGEMRRAGDLAELRRLITEYPNEARFILGEVTKGK